MSKSRHDFEQIRFVYSTSYCNQGHWIDTGRPVGHECYVIPPRLLIAERDGDIDAMVLWSEWLSSSARKRTVAGRPAK